MGSPIGPYLYAIAAHTGACAMLGNIARSSWLLVLKVVLYVYALYVLCAERAWHGRHGV